MTPKQSDGEAIDAATLETDYRADRNLDPTWTAGRDFAIENGRNAGG